MTLKLDLSEELEAELTVGAAREGVPVETYALRLLSASQADFVSRPARNWSSIGVGKA